MISLATDDDDENKTSGLEVGDAVLDEDALHHSEETGIAAGVKEESSNLPEKPKVAPAEEAGEEEVCVCSLIISISDLQDDNSDNFGCLVCVGYMSGSAQRRIKELFSNSI